MITCDSNTIKVKGHRGTWYVIDSGLFYFRDASLQRELFLLEHESYGDEAACVIVDNFGVLIMEGVWNGFLDLKEAGWETFDAE